MQKIGIVGFGRFGQILFKLLVEDFEIHVYEKNKHAYHKVSVGVLRKIRIADNPRELYKEVKTIFYCVPISAFEKTISDHQNFFDNHLLIDVLSVKMHALKIFRKFLTRKTFSRAILTHPMFGPDSSKSGFENLTIVMDNHSATKAEYDFWKKFFKSKKLNVVEMDAKKHDRLAAHSQGVAHFVGRILGEIKFSSTVIDTNGVKKLHELKENVCNDSFELFLNLHNYNSFTKDMRLSFGSAYEKLYNRLLPEKISPDKNVYGIQGGKASFNEAAINFYFGKNNIRDAKVKYLYTTENVLRSLNRGDIDFGQFALDNTLGGIVGESLEAMSRYKFKIIDEFFIQIRHVLMKKNGVEYKDIDMIMAHPQVLKQCAATLKKNYPKLKLISGVGDLVDTANAAKALSLKKISETTAILGPKGLAELYNFEIIAEDLQDDNENFTTFLIVKRK